MFGTKVVSNSYLFQRNLMCCSLIFPYRFFSTRVDQTLKNCAVTTAGEWCRVMFGRLLSWRMLHGDKAREERRLDHILLFFFSFWSISLFSLLDFFTSAWDRSGHPSWAWEYKYITVQDKISSQFWQYYVHTYCPLVSNIVIFSDRRFVSQSPWTAQCFPG